MRKTSYVVTFFAVAIVLALNVYSVNHPNWLIVDSWDGAGAKVTLFYGLQKLCESRVVRIPTPSGDGQLEYRDFKCRPFPKQVEDNCEKENRALCIEWTSANYASELGVGFSATALFALLFGISTRSRRRRIWRAIAAMILFQTAFQIVTFAIVTDLYRTSNYSPFKHAKFGMGYVLNAISWILSFLVAVGVIFTGISADMGSRWAAGNRPYQPIGP